MNIVKRDKQKKKDIAFLLGLLAGFFFLLWKSKYGTGAYDEPFYLTIPHRIVNGDGMFSEEWNFGQFSSFLMLPLMKVYLLITGTTEGIVLNFRYIYIVFQAVCSLVLYVRLRKKELAWVGAWMFFLFTPFDIMALSYNTMGVACITLVGAILATAKKNATGAWVVSGVLFGAAVLCNPFLAIVYFLYSLAVAFSGFRQRRSGVWNKRERGEETEEMVGSETILGGKAWLCITAGAGGLALLFAIAVLWHSPVSELLENIPLLINDPEHTSRSVVMIVKVYLSEFWRVFGFFIPVWIVFLFMAFCFRKNSLNRKLCFILLCFSAAVSVLGFIPTIQNSYNFIMVPVAVCGLGAYLMTEEKDKQSFFYFFVFGLVYSFMANYASNQGMHAISMAMLPADVAAVLFIGRFVEQEREVKEDGSQKRSDRALKAGVTITVVLLFAVQFGMQIYTKTVHTFWEEPVWKLDTRITEGPLKGTVTTEEKAEEYQVKLEDIRTHLKKDGPVLFATKDTWCYLYADGDYATFSSYLSGGLEQAAERWEVYYKVHPEKIPYYIYVPKENSEEWAAQIQQKAEEYGYRAEESGQAYHLYKK